MTAAAINPRLAGLRESATLAMNQKSRALRAAGREVALFGFGESPFAVHPKMQAALAAAAGEKSYLPALGLPRLREAVAAHHRRATGLDFSAARIAVAPGSKEAIFHLLYALAGPLILPLPAWVSYAPQARLLGKTTLAVETDYASGYKIDPARLDSVLAQAGAPQSVMILTSPNNPSGQGYAESEWREIAAVCRRRNVFVIADEIYAELTFSDSDSIAPSFAVHCPERVVVTGGLSKSRAAGVGGSVSPPPPRRASTMFSPPSRRLSARPIPACARRCNTRRLSLTRTTRFSLTRAIAPRCCGRFWNGRGGG